MTGKIKVDQGVVDGTVIALYRNNALLKNIDVNRTGSFRIAVDLNHTYRFVFNNPFYYSKTIEIDTHVPSEARASDAVFPPYQLSLMLYRKVPGVNETQQEIGRISYNPKIDQFDAELIRQETDFKKLIDEALSEIKEKSRLYETQTAKAKKQKYAQHIADADHFFRTGKYSEAMNEYRQAVLSQPSELYPRNKVDEAYRILIAEQLHHSFGPPGEDNFLKYLNYGDAQFAQREYSHARVAYSLALKFRPDDENVKRKLAESEVETAKLQDLALAEVRHRDEVYALRTQRYRELIAKGDQKFRAEVIAAARDFYAQAATQIDENSYALLMLQKIGDILSNDEMALKLARERDEAQKKRLIEARNRAYDDAIHEADARFHQGDFQQALENYELALTIKSFELYPRQQINAINDIRAKMQISGEEYRRLLREGEDLMARFEYGTARNSFVKAHALIPNEQYALEKIAAIDNILAQQNEQNKIDTQYRQEIESADRLYAEKKYNEAIAGYQKALKWKPDESYPFDQIQRIRGILSRESDEQKRIQQRQSDYDQMVRKADEAFDQQS
ncbi:MAG TPA: hypothetical protein PLK12_09835, partial [Prolixibacteraceae bacterium]|nr:hypothetical protein [Prolixibacteraceae bacterium]